MNDLPPSLPTSKPSLAPVVISCFAPPVATLASFFSGLKGDQAISLAAIMGGVALLVPLITGMVVGRRRSIAAGVPSYGAGILTAMLATTAGFLLGFVVFFFGCASNIKF